MNMICRILCIGLMTKGTNPLMCCILQVGMFVLFTVAQTATDQLKPHLESILQLLVERLADVQNHMVPYYAIR